MKYYLILLFYIGKLFHNYPFYSICYVQCKENFVNIGIFIYISIVLQAFEQFVIKQSELYQAFSK